MEIKSKHTTEHQANTEVTTGAVMSTAGRDVKHNDESMYIPFLS